MGTSNRFKGPRSSKNRIVGENLGVSNGAAFGSFIDANWKGAKTIISRQIEAGKSDYYISTIKSLLSKSGALEAFVASLDPGISIFINVALAAYGIETKDNLFIVKTIEGIKKFKKIYDAYVWIAEHYLGGNTETSKENSALRDSIIYFIEKQEEMKIMEYSINEKIKVACKDFIVKYIENQIDVYLGEKYELTKVSNLKLIALKEQATKELLKYTNTYEFKNDQNTKEGLKIELQNLVKHILQSILEDE